MSNGAAYGDLDNDGDLDLVVNNVNMHAFVYENNTNSKREHNYIKVDIRGTEKNPFAIGSTILLYYDDNTVLQELMPSRGFQSSMEYVQTIGLGTTSQLDSLRIIWPDDKTLLMKNVAANQLLKVNYADAVGRYTVPKKIIPKTLVRELDNVALSAHEENNYNDFDYEGLIYKQLSQEGPAMAVGDINGDGHEDVFLGGAKDQTAVLYKHMGQGSLRAQPQTVFTEDARYEDTAAAFFDADGDGDIDLMVGTGGNQVGDEGSYRSRLYLNDGTGKFSRSSQPIPSVFKNISVIAPHDFDSDGDIDVMVGSRSVVGTYGVDPDHIFLENNGDGSFLDATERLAYDLKDGGMMTDAIWADIDGDSKEDLVTVSEWGTPKIYRNSGRRLTKLDASLDSLHGWWNTVEAADLDKDGDLDLVLGNKGRNIHYKPEEGRPMKMWINDFDDNGTIEQIVTLHSNGRDFPIHQKKELTEQMVKLKKENLKASEYARRSVDELFPKEIFDNSIMKQSSISESVIAVNNGDGNFDIIPLPPRVQLSCVCDISCIDVDEDGNLDLVLGGNNYEFKPQFSRLDANYGSVLLGDGKFGFQWQDYSSSGFYVRDEIKHLKTFRDKKGNSFMIVAINDNKPKIFELDE